MIWFISKTFSQHQVDWFLFWIIFIAKSWFRNFWILPQKTILPKIILGKGWGVGWFLFWIIFKAKFCNFKFYQDKNFCRKSPWEKGGVGKRWRHLGGMAKMTEDDGGGLKTPNFRWRHLWTLPNDHVTLKNMFKRI